MKGGQHGARPKITFDDVLVVTETQHQQSLYKWWKQVCRYYGLPVQVFFHPPNEAKRSLRVAAIEKSIGMQKGVPDILITVARGGYHGLWIELKNRKGRPTPEQLEYIKIQREQGYRAEVCYGWDSARELIESYLQAEA